MLSFIVVGNRFHDFGVSLNRKDGRSLVSAIATGGDHRENLSAIGKFQSQGKRAVGLKANRFASNGYGRSRVGRTVHNHVSVDLKVESLTVGVNA